MHITGEPDGSPVKVGVAITDLTTGLYLKSAVLAALISRSQTGEGVWIDANLFDSQVGFLLRSCESWRVLALTLLPYRSPLSQTSPPTTSSPAKRRLGKGLLIPGRPFSLLPGGNR